MPSQSRLHEFSNLEREAHRQCGAPTDGFAVPGDRPTYLRDLPVAQRHIKVSCHFDLQRKRVHGEAELTMKPNVVGVERIDLDCADTVVEEVRLDGREIKFSHVGDTLTAHLGQPLQTLDELVLNIKYMAEPRLGLYFTGPDEAYPDKPTQIWSQGQDTDNHHWFPCIDEPRGRVTSEIICTVPKSWTVISNGRLVADDTEEASSTRTVHWLQDKEHSVYLITLVAGEFARVVLQDKGPLVDFYCAPGREEDGKRSFENTAAMLKLFSEVTGQPYPWDKYTQVAVQDFIFGGMENTSATTQTDLTLHDAKAHKDFSSDFLVAHEAAHQWFGDYLTCREWPHGWLNEGFATFLETLWQEHHLGRDEYVWEVIGMARGYLAEAYRRPIVHRNYSNPIDIFDRHLYEKGALVLHMLRLELGQDLFTQAIQHYVSSNINRNVVTPDLQRAIDEATGRNMDWFFDQWVYRKGHPDFQVSYQWDEESKTASFSVEQKQKDEPFRCTLEVAFLYEGKRVTHTATVTERHQTLAYRLDEQPQGVQFDTGYGIVKTLKFKRPRSMLVFQLENDEDVAGRAGAASDLAEDASPAAVRALAEALAEDKFWGVQSAAAEALGKIRTPEARDALIANAGVKHLKARRAVAAALGEFRDDAKAHKALQKMLASTDSYYVSATAATALGRVRDASALGLLKKALKRESHREVIQAGALMGISYLDTDDAAAVLLEWTRWGHPHTARQAAAAALRNLGEGRRKCEERLIELLLDPWFQVKIAAIGALQHLEVRKAVPALRNLAARELDGRVARTALKAVESIEKSAGTNKRLDELREEFEKLSVENKSLKERLSKLEGTDKD